MNAAASLRQDIGRSLDLAVDNTAFLVDRLGSDCGPLQFVRELTQNALEAGATEVIWDADEAYAQRGFSKLCIVDNGAGMAEEDLLHSIRKLFVRSHGKEQGLGRNFGVGAKISTLTRNPLGVIYVSKKEDHPAAMVHVWRDPVSGSYGFKQLEVGPDEYAHSIAVDDASLHPLIRRAGHGTMVVLLGRAADEDTTQPPDGAFPVTDPWGRQLRVRWLHRYLNARYLRFPESVVIKVRAFSDIPRERQLSRVTGQKDFLDRYAQESGVKELRTARVLWWILRRDAVGGDAAGWQKVHSNAGHVAAIYQDELYDIASGKSGVSRLQRMGIIMGHRQVVLYLEPKIPVIANTARTTLLQHRPERLADNDGEIVSADPLPWEAWEEEFRSNMPSEIRRHVDELSAASAGMDHRQAIHKRLEEIKDLFKIPRFRPILEPEADSYLVQPADDGDGDASEGSAPQQAQVHDAEPSGTAPAGGTSGTDPHRSINPYSYRTSEEGQPAQAKMELQPPDTRWVSIKDGTREPGDLEDRAGRYLAEQNLLLLNRDFRVFTSAIERWQRRYGDRPGVAHAVENKVLEWAEQVLIEAVLGMKSFKGSKAWTVEDLQRAISEEALTCAAQPRSFIEDRLRHSLSLSIGPIARG